MSTRVSQKPEILDFGCEMKLFRKDFRRKSAFETDLIDFLEFFLLYVTAIIVKC